MHSSIQPGPLPRPEQAAPPPTRLPSVLSFFQGASIMPQRAKMSMRSFSAMIRFAPWYMPKG